VSFIERVTAFENRMLDRARSAEADRVARDAATGSIASLKKAKYCVLVTYRKNGDPIPSPLWFALADGKVYAHSGGMKLKRIERNPRIRVAPCTFRGKPTGAPFTGTARVLPAGETDVAERGLQKKYGLTRTLYYKVFHQDDLGAYIEVTPDA
jgi:PPOX class probable F420-dependent enzyme